jgi:voltage-gated potassium channel
MRRAVPSTSANSAIMPRAPTDLTQHYIVCGFGRVGHEVVAGLRERNRPVVAIDRDPAALTTPGGVHTSAGDATTDAVLSDAGVGRARGLVAATGSDATNLAIALSARALNPNLRIVARANQPTWEAKLLRAGATRVVSPYAIGAHRMATQLVSPGVTAFLDALGDAEQVDLWIEEVTIAVGSPLAECLVRDALPRTPGLPNLIAIRRSPEGRLSPNPSPELRLAHGDTLIVVGSRAQLSELIVKATAGAAHVARIDDRANRPVS